MDIIIDDPIALVRANDDSITFKFYDGEVYGSNITLIIKFNKTWSGGKEDYKKLIVEALK